jgi:hypothetical protein
MRIAVAAKDTAASQAKREQLDSAASPMLYAGDTRVGGLGGRPKALSAAGRSAQIIDAATT